VQGEPNVRGACVRMHAPTCVCRYASLISLPLQPSHRHYPYGNALLTGQVDRQLFIYLNCRQFGMEPSRPLGNHCIMGVVVVHCIVGVVVVHLSYRTLTLYSSGRRLGMMPWV